ncbi:hypothetical protein Tco_0322431 [Tanacetum coccineum]
MEPRPEPTRAATPPLQVASPRPHRRGERTVGFEGDQSKGESRVERNTKWGRPLEEAPRGNKGQSVNLPPLLAAHLGRGQNGQPLQSSLTSVYGGQTLPNNIGRNLPPNGTSLAHHAQPFIPASLSIPNGFMPTDIHPYQQPTSFVNMQHLSFPTQTLPGNLPMRGLPAHLPQEGQQKKFTKTHLAVHNIKQREGESIRAFITRYTDDTLQLMGLHKEQGIFGFIHGLRTRSLVEHLSTDLPSTYKGLMEKIYSWVEAREVATNGVSNN